jgi:CYTH domain-containing protein
MALEIERRFLIKNNNWKEFINKKKKKKKKKFILNKDIYPKV